MTRTPPACVLCLVPIHILLSHQYVLQQSNDPTLLTAIKSVVDSSGEFLFVYGHNSFDNGGELSLYVTKYDRGMLSRNVSADEAIVFSHEFYVVGLDRRGMMMKSLDMVIDDDDMIYLTMFNVTWRGNYGAGALLKMDADGSILWRKNFKIVSVSDPLYQLDTDQFGPSVPTSLAVAPTALFAAGVYQGADLVFSTFVMRIDPATGDTEWLTAVDLRGQWMMLTLSVSSGSKHLALVGHYGPFGQKLSQSLSVTAMDARTGDVGWLHVLQVPEAGVFNPSMSFGSEGLVSLMTDDAIVVGFSRVDDGAAYLVSLDLYSREVMWGSKLNAYGGNLTSLASISFGDRERNTIIVGGQYGHAT